MTNYLSTNLLATSFVALTDPTMARQALGGWYASLIGMVSSSNIPTDGRIPEILPSTPMMTRGAHNGSPDTPDDRMFTTPRTPTTSPAGSTDTTPGSTSSAEWTTPPSRSRTPTANGNSNRSEAKGYDYNISPGLESLFQIDDVRAILLNETSLLSIGRLKRVSSQCLAAVLTYDQEFRRIQFFTAPCLAFGIDTKAHPRYANAAFGMGIYGLKFFAVAGYHGGGRLSNACQSFDVQYQMEIRREKAEKARSTNDETNGGLHTAENISAPAPDGLSRNKSLRCNHSQNL